MPQMADITIKKADGTTDVVYTALVPSGGDRFAAFWQGQTQGPNPSLQPLFSTASRWNGSQTARRVDLTYRWVQYYTNPANTQPTLANVAPFSGSFLLPMGFDQSNAVEAAAQLGNLISSALVQEILRTGYSAS